MRWCDAERQVRLRLPHHSLIVLLESDKCVGCVIKKLDGSEIGSGQPKCHLASKENRQQREAASLGYRYDNLDVNVLCRAAPINDTSQLWFQVQYLEILTKAY